jgi:hypothetical protein
MHDGHRMHTMPDESVTSSSRWERATSDVGGEDDGREALRELGGRARLRQRGYRVARLEGHLLSKPCPDPY